MAFLLNEVVPWGRTLTEYRRMFNLTDQDMKLRIASFGDGPAGFNAEGTRMGTDITSYDILYQYTSEEIRKRIAEVRDVVMEQMRRNQQNYVWTQIRDLEELEQLRMNAMAEFLDDYESGKKEGRYIFHSLPDKLNVDNKYYDLGLSSHFLLMYTELGYEFHKKAVSEMLRICKEVRIFPICDLDGKDTELTGRLMDYFGNKYEVTTMVSEYQFQKGNNKMLIIK